MDVRFCLVFPREALSVPVMRHVLGDTLRVLGAEDDAVADLLLAVTEACTNVVRHGGPGRGYEVVARLGRGGCLIQVLDSGNGLDPAAVRGVRLRRLFWPPVTTKARMTRRVARPATPGRPPRRSRHRNYDEQIGALPESGRGMAIMQACVDDVTLTSGPQRGTVVSLQKRMAWRDDGPWAAGRPGELRHTG